MVKSKRQPKNFLHYFLDKFILFRHDFYFEIEGKPKILLEKLKALRHENEGCIGFGRRIVPIINQIDDTWQFEIRIERKGRRIYIPTTIANGRIFPEPDRTYCLEGSISMNGVTVAVLWGCELIFLLLTLYFIFRIAFSITTSFLIRDLYFAIAPHALMACMWFPHWLDRNHLYKRIQSVVESTENEFQND